MIVKEYYQNIDCHHPKNYFERWYADVWHRRVGKRIAPSGYLEPILAEELEKVGATFTEKDNGYKFIVTYNNDDNYLLFCLKWS